MQQPIPVVFKKPTPTFCRICRIAVLPLLLLRIAIVVLYSVGLELYFANIPHQLWGFFLDVLLLGALAGSVWLGTLRRSTPFIIVFLLVCAVYAANLFPYLSEYNEQEFVSPSKKSAVVVRSKGYMYSGKVSYYEKQGVLLRDTKEGFALDEGFQSIGSARLEVSWNEEETEVSLTYLDLKTGEILLEKKISV